jgi:ribosomal-protein-alanine N-acetyltransferase
VSARAVESLIRRMTMEDLPRVLQIDRLSFPVPWPERTYRYELTENSAAHLIVAEAADQTVVGYAGYWLLVDEAHISTLAVHPDYRRRGIGEELLRTALRDGAERGADLATLEVRPSNKAAVDLYRKYGFEVVGRRTRYYRDNDEDAWIMSLKGLVGVVSQWLPPM